MRRLGLSRLVLVLELMLSGCRPHAPEIPAIDLDLVKMVPQDAVMLAGTRMAEVRTTEAYKLFGQNADTPALDRFSRDTGFDPRKDIRELLVASDGKDTVFLARGSFAVTNLTEPDATKSIYRGQTLITHGQWSAAFLDATTVAAGATRAVQSAIDRRRQGGGGIPAAIAERMKTIPKDSQMWIVTLGLSPAVEKAIPERGNLSNLRRLLMSVDSATAGMNLRSGAAVIAEAVCRTDADAKFMHDAFRGLVGMGRLTVPDNEPEMLKFYDAIQISLHERTVRVQASIPMEVLQKLAARMKPMTATK